MSDYNEEFDRLRRNRVEMSFYKYGPARDNFGGGRVDALATAERCIEAFKKDKKQRAFGRRRKLFNVSVYVPLSGRLFQSDR